MAIPDINVLGNPNVTEGNFQVAIEDLRKSVIGSGKAYDSSNTYSLYDTCVYGVIVYYSKINSNTGNTPIVGVNWGLIGDLITGVVHNVGNETIAGNKNFTGNLLMTGASSVIGYGTGSGGTVTQYTSKETSVTLNKPTGTITMSNAALAPNVKVSFLFNNSLISAADTLLVSVIFGSTVLTQYEARARCALGIASIVLSHTYPTSLSDAVVIKFDIIKGAEF